MTHPALKSARNFVKIIKVFNNLRYGAFDSPDVPVGASMKKGMLNILKAIQVLIKAKLCSQPRMAF